MKSRVFLVSILEETKTINQELKNIEKCVYFEWSVQSLDETLALFGNQKNFRGKLMKI